MTNERLSDLLDDLRKQPAEQDWVEFKTNNADPQMIGRMISSLANSAAFCGRPLAWLVWGISDERHDVVGTSFKPDAEKASGQPLEFWLAQRLKPECVFRFHMLSRGELSVVLLEIEAAARSPISFDGTPYIRIGPTTPKLQDFPERQRRLWQMLSAVSFEMDVAAAGVSVEDVLGLLDIQAYFDLIKQPLPDGRRAILERVEAEGLIRRDVGERWNILNLGALLFARKLSSFERLSRKAIRTIVYKGRSRIEAVREQVAQRGYAAGFTGIMAYLTDTLPTNELIGRALREDRPLYPEIALRELVANALLHQDLSVSGAGPMIEIFHDRIEITNPGMPLVEPQRFLDLPPRSRNETMAGLMRRMNICEERGSGVDKVISSAEVYQLPPPDFRVVGDNTKAILYAPRPLSKMDREERIRAAYQHAGIMFVSGQPMTNPSLRERFGIAEKNAAMATRVIKEAMEAGLIKPSDPANRSRKMASYHPYWG